MRGKLKGYKVQYNTHINNSLNSVSIEVSHESDWYACIRYSNPYCRGVLLESNFSSVSTSVSIFPASQIITCKP